MKLQITVDGRVYAVDVEVLEDEDCEPALIHSPHHAAAGGPSQNASGSWSADGRVCHSPVMGLVIKVNVETGQTVETGALMLVLEAMKMETPVTAPHAGRVKTVHVKPGDPVKVNQMLVEFD